MPYTTDGHWYGDGKPTLPGPRLVARCGGIYVCPACAREAGTDRLPAAAEPAPPEAGAPVTVDEVRAACEQVAHAFTALAATFRPDGELASTASASMELGVRLHRFGQLYGDYFAGCLSRSRSPFDPDGPLGGPGFAPC